MRKIVFLIFYILFSGEIFAQTTDLGPGDIAILQYNSDASPEEMKFLALKSMESGTVINFTDNGWNSDNTFRTGEGTHVWTAPSNVKAGDIITVSLTGIALATNGDQILAYQGLSSSPTFLFAINNQGSAVWQSTANNAASSALPSGLTNGSTAIAITEIDNAIYTGSTTGNISTILGNICTNGNWGGSNTVNQTFSGTFTSETTWNGTTWSLATPANYFNAIINGTYDTSTDGNLTANELTVNASQILTVNSGGNVTITNSITNNGTIVVEDNGSFVQERKDGPNTGTNYTVERTSTSQQEERDYTYWSSPITSATLANVTTASRNYSFTAATQSWATATSATSMTPGLGYITTGNSAGSYPGTYTASFSGSPFNNGDVSVTLGFTDDVDPETDWNLLGNPYPSAIDADAFIAGNSTIGGTLYFWTHNTEDSAGDNTADDYVFWNGAGSISNCSGCTAPNGFIASGQAFFAQALSVGSATFTNSMRVTGSNSNFYKSSKTEKDRIWLNLTSEKNFSQILIGFFDNATDGVDRIYDGLRLEGEANISFNSTLNDKPYGIQGKSALKIEETIPLQFSSKITGDFKITIHKTEGFIKEFSEVLLEDKELNVTHNLKNSDYEFTVTNTGTNKDRFVLKINTQKLSVEDDLVKENQVVIFSNNNGLQINSQFLMKSVQIYTILGQRIFDNNNQKTLSIPKYRLGSPKLLIVKIQLESGKIITKKIFHSTL